MSTLTEAPAKFGPCPTRIHDGYEEPNRRTWRYAHAANIPGAHWNIYTATGDINRDYFIGMVCYEADAAAIVESHNATLSEQDR